MQFVMRMRPRAHVQTTSTSARHGVTVLSAPQGSGTGLIVVLVMARRHLTSVHHDGPEAPKACPRIARLASIRTHNNTKVPEHLHKLSTSYWVPSCIPHARVRLVACFTFCEYSTVGGDTGAVVPTVYEFTNLRIYEFYRRASDTKCTEWF